MGKFLVTQYPDSTRGLFGVQCPAILDDVIDPHVSVGVEALEAILLVEFPGRRGSWPRQSGGASCPLHVDFFETQSAGNTILPGGGSNADHGLDKIIADAATGRAHNTVPWEHIDGIIDDFQGSGAISGHQGHGCCAPDPWIRTTLATNVQGPYVPVFRPIVHNLTLGTLHPNAAGHADYAAHIFEHLASLLRPRRPAVARRHRRSAPATRTRRTTPSPTRTARQRSVPRKETAVG